MLSMVNSFSIIFKGKDIIMDEIIEYTKAEMKFIDWEKRPLNAIKRLILR